MVTCNLSYSQWRETLVSKDVILPNLPSHENVAQELLINMRINANSIGEYDDARIYVYESENKSRLYNLKKVKAATKYYKNKYSVDQRVGAFAKYLKSHVERMLWGYGEKVLNLSISVAMIVIIFAAGYFLSNQKYFMENSQNSVPGGYILAIKTSLSVFTGFNLAEIDNNLKHTLYNWFLFEALLGIIFIGFLAASLHRRISMRRD